MLILNLIYIYLISLGIIYVTGMLVTSFLLKRESLYWSLAPIIGLAFIVSLYSALFALRISLNTIILVHLLSIFAGLFFSFRKLPSLLRSYSIQFLVLGGLSMLCYLFLCYPLVSGEASFPPARNADPEVYCAFTDFLMNLSLPAKSPENIGHLVEVQQFGFNTGFRLGFNILHALISKILRTSSYLSFHPMVSFCWSLFVFPAFCFFQQTRSFSKQRRYYFGSIVFSALFFFNVAIFTHAAEGAASASMGLVFLFTAFFILPELLHRNILNSRTFCLMGIMLTALMSTYPVVLVYFFLSLIILIFLDRKCLKGVVFILFSFAINPVALIWFSKWFYMVLGFVFTHRGGELWPFAGPDEWLGLYHYDFGTALTVVLRWCTVGLAFILAGKFFWNSKPEMRLLLVASVAPFLIAFVFTRWILLYPYAFYKNMIFFVPLGLLIISGGITDDARRPNNRLVHWLLSATFLSLFFFANTSLHRKLFHIFPSETFSRFPSFIALEKFMEKTESHPAQIHISDIGFTEGMWLAYFLKHCDLTYDRFIPNFLYSLPIDFSYKGKGWFIENTNTLVDLWEGEVLNETGTVTFYQQRSDELYTLVRSRDRGIYCLEKEVYGNPHYTLLQKTKGNLSHLNFYDGTLLLEAPLVIACSTSSLSIAGRSYSIQLPKEKPIGILIHVWGNINITPEAAVDSYPPYYLLKLPTGVRGMEFKILPHGKAWLGGALNLIDQTKVPVDFIEKLPPFIPFKSVLPNSNAFLLDGCFNLEKGNDQAWRWTKKRTSFYIERLESRSLLRLRLSASPYIDQEITMYLNGQEMARLKLKAGKDFEGVYPLDNEALKNTGNYLTFNISDTFQPHTFNGLGDTRNLGVCLRNLAVEPTSNANDS